MSIQELLEQGRRRLEKKEEANWISKILLAYFLKQDRTYLIINKNEKVSNDIERQYKQAIEKIAKGYPLQYITHQQEFMKLNFYVDENVLIPRADTEILVEEMIKKSKNEEITILDMCTGSGAIGISLAKYLPNAQVYLADISEKALAVAKTNAKTNEVEKQTEWIQSNMFENIPNIPFDMIVSNPPYIETNTIPQLERQVQQEPYLALDGGKDGLDFYRILAQRSYQFLKPEGVLGLEIGYNQKERVKELLEEMGEYQNVKSKQDLAGNDRIITAQRR